MRVRFCVDYQGQYTGPHFYLAGEVADIDRAAALRLIDDGRAVEVTERKQRKPRKRVKNA